MRGTPHASSSLRFVRCKSCRGETFRVTHLRRKSRRVRITIPTRTINGTASMNSTSSAKASAPPPVRSAATAIVRAAIRLSWFPNMRRANDEPMLVARSILEKSEVPAHALVACQDSHSNRNDTKSAPSFPAALNSENGDDLFSGDLVGTSAPVPAPRFRWHGLKSRFTSWSRRHWIDCHPFWCFD